MSAQPRRILITGASGFVGRHLTAALSIAHPDSILLTPEMELRDAASVVAAVKDNSPDVCFHLAAVSAVTAAQLDQELAWQVNLHGSLHLADAIVRHAPDCHLFYVSSAEAYGASFGPGEQLNETAPLAPMSLYGATKAAADLALGSRAFQHGLRLTRLRSFNHTGPGQSPQFVIAAFARQIVRIAAGQQPNVLRVGNLNSWRDFLDVRDICTAYVACIDRKDVLPANTVINLGSGVARRIGDVLDELQGLAGISLNLEVDPSRVRATELRVAACDAAKARALLDWQPAIEWTRTLTDVLQDWRIRVAQNPDAA